MSLPQQNKSPKKEEQKIPAGLPLDLSAGLPGVAAPGTAAGNTAAAVAAASYSPYEILDFIRKNNGRPIRPEGASPPQDASITPMGLGPSQSSGPGPGPDVISPGVRPSPQPVTVESSSLVIPSISPEASVGGSPALSLPVPSGDGGAAWREASSIRAGQSSGPGPGVISPGVRPSPQPVTVESSSLVMSSISPDAPVGGSPALSLPLPSGAAWPGSIKHPGRMTPEERRIRKNAQSRVRASQMRAKIEMARQKPGLSTDEKALLETFEERRNRKNVRSRQRAMEKKAEVERILATPLSKRGERDIDALNVTLAAKRRKNEGDRIRREKIKEENNKNNQVQSKFSPGPGPDVISSGVRPSPQPVTVESSSLVMSSIFVEATVGGALSVPVPSGDGGAAWPGSIKHRGRMTQEERRVRKNAQSRVRASQIRANIDMMRQKSGLSTDEKILLGTFENRRNRKNVRSKQRAMEKKAEVERILATPLSKRGERDIDALRVTLDAKRRKNEGDRIRREKIKEEKNKNNQVARQRGRPRKYHPKTGSLQPETAKSSHIRPKSKGLLPIETEGSSLPAQVAPDSIYQFNPTSGQVPIQAAPNPMFPMNSLAGQVPIQAALGSMFGMNPPGGQLPIQAAPGPMFSMNPATGQMLPTTPPFSTNAIYQMPPAGLP
eukprot:CAMPEP_0194345336 /NCGR_PEP_ID=MMETSP0171-20130528/104796_1 /TAXON_ID=218684 /ORGANISM="Corethron pennatum, Strain L29A3" /LENGTH=665 /DNA_ID=CAMNT_0039112303 /DNA_START=297 /DNA_END=2293 /DNA_ORIENTATION=-